MRFFGILLAIVSAWAFARAPSVENGGCKPRDSFGDEGITWLKDLVADTSLAARSLKEQLKVDAVLADEVFLVDVDALCTQAARSRATASGYTYDNAPAYVYKLGTQYVVDAPVDAGWQRMHVQDALFRHVGWMAR